MRPADAPVPVAPSRSTALWTDARFTQWKQGVYMPWALQRVIEDLEHYHRQPIQAIAQRYWAAREGETPIAESSARVLAEVYQTTDQYVYESTYFEAFAEYQRYFETVRCACAQFRRAPVLDFGGGAGGMALTLSLAGMDCDYADVPGPTSDYARWRLQRRGCASRILDATQPLPRSRYRAIVTLDVFEHLQDLRSTLRELVRALVPGGWLISKSTFAPDDPLHLPHNMVYAKVEVFNQLLAECGLVYRGRLRPDPFSELLYAWWHRPDVLRVWLDPKPKFGGRFMVHELGLR